VGGNESYYFKVEARNAIKPKFPICNFSTYKFVAQELKFGCQIATSTAS